jgi:glycosyltransferase involved in cell wall biosynthesis
LPLFLRDEKMGGKNMPPAITVVMPVYNTEKYVRKAVDSVLNQDFTDFELILIDDGSTDSCPAILDAYAVKDPRVRVYHQPNAGVYAGFNRGVDLAAGDYITFVCSDDYVEPDFLSIPYQYAEQYQVDLVFINVVARYCNLEQVETGGAIVSNEMDEEFVILGRENVRLCWPGFIQYFLPMNPINLYAARIMKRHSFRNDVYGADYLYNLMIADDIESVACHPKNLYHQFVYIGETDAKRNLSAGKYYAYEHAMYTEFYTQSVELFASWDILTHDTRVQLADMRVDRFYVENNSLDSSHCPLTPEEKVKALVSYVDDVVAETARVTGRLLEVHNLVLERCVAFYRQAGARFDGLIRATDCFILRLINSSVAFQGRPSERHLESFRDAVLDKENPYRIGLYTYESYARQLQSRTRIKEAKYLLLKEELKFLVNTRQLDQAAQKIKPLLDGRKKDPERYSIVGCYYLLRGDYARARVVLESGAVRFPADEEIEYYLNYLNSLNIELHA